jgi:hypothetical protein
MENIQLPNVTAWAHKLRITQATTKMMVMADANAKSITIS